MGDSNGTAVDLVTALNRHYTGGEGHRDADSHAAGLRLAEQGASPMAEPPITTPWRTTTHDLMNAAEADRHLPAGSIILPMRDDGSTLAPLRRFHSGAWAFGPLETVDLDQLVADRNIDSLLVLYVPEPPAPLRAGEAITSAHRLLQVPHATIVVCLGGLAAQVQIRDGEQYWAHPGEPEEYDAETLIARNGQIVTVAWLPGENQMPSLRRPAGRRPD
ncbi:MAG: hypothetical protein M3N43_00860 [Actinomycetota bacterium]|nr:hypothetical protein [Actinomycetota bacterium]